MLLYHFTDDAAWPLIEASGRLEPRWPQELGGSYVTRFVHLSVSDAIEVLPEAKRHLTLRMAVEVPEDDAVAWVPWLTANHPEGVWTLGDRPRQLGSKTVRDGDASQWYVVGREIPSTEWLSVVDIRTGRALWTR